jgi:hypothetical protein
MVAVDRSIPIHKQHWHTVYHNGWLSLKSEKKKKKVTLSKQPAMHRQDGFMINASQALTFHKFGMNHFYLSSFYFNSWYLPSLKSMECV